MFKYLPLVSVGAASLIEAPCHLHSVAHFQYLCDFSSLFVMYRFLAL